MDGLYGRPYKNWMIWGYHHLRKHPDGATHVSTDSPRRVHVVNMMGTISKHCRNGCIFDGQVRRKPFFWWLPHLDPGGLGFVGDDISYPVI